MGGVPSTLLSFVFYVRWCTSAKSNSHSLPSSWIFSLRHVGVPDLALSRLFFFSFPGFGLPASFPSPTRVGRRRVRRCRGRAACPDRARTLAALNACAPQRPFFNLLLFATQRSGCALALSSARLCAPLPFSSLWILAEGARRRDGAPSPPLSPQLQSSAAAFLSPGRPPRAARFTPSSSLLTDVLPRTALTRASALAFVLFFSSSVVFRPPLGICLCSLVFRFSSALFSRCPLYVCVCVCACTGPLPPLLPPPPAFAPAAAPHPPMRHRSTSCSGASRFLFPPIFLFSCSTWSQASTS